MTTSRKRGGRPLKGKKKKQKAAARAAAAGPAFGALPSRTKPPTAAPEPAAQDPSVSDVEDERIVSLADIRDQMTAPTAPDSLSEDDSDDASTVSMAVCMISIVLTESQIRGTNAEMGGSALSDDDDIPFSEDEDHTEDEFDIAAGSVATTSVWGETQLGFEGMTKSELYRSSIQGRFGKDIEVRVWPRHISGHLMANMTPRSFSGTTFGPKSMSGRCFTA